VGDGDGIGIELELLSMDGGVCGSGQAVAKGGDDGMGKVAVRLLVVDLPIALV
jgi:hypothetical protein